MKTLHVTLRPLTAFGTPLAGDTLFGHLCWALRWRHGEEALRAALQGYTAGKPFLVASDAFPSGYLPRPTLPSNADDQPTAIKPEDRKAERRKRWLPLASRHLPLKQWLGVAEEVNPHKAAERTQNTINRLTSTTGRGQFAPRQVPLREHAPGTTLDIYLVHDPERITPDDLVRLLSDVGDVGYGRDASTGLGKFEVVSVAETKPHPESQRFMTLAPCAPEPTVLRAEDCRWLPLTRFGRHGSSAALGVGSGPFKRPILMAATAAVWVTRAPWRMPFFGCGLGGEGQPLSGAIAATVHQGYAPVYPLNSEFTL
jgi:CRISPR-associated protein Csm4